jgi:hypothetical protein
MERKVAAHIAKAIAIPSLHEKLLRFILTLPRVEISAMKYGPIRKLADIIFSACLFGQLGKVRGGGVKGMLSTDGEKLEADARATSALEGLRSAIGVARTYAGDPTIGFAGVSHARIEQSSCPEITNPAQSLLSF